MSDLAALRFQEMTPHVLEQYGQLARDITATVDAELARRGLVLDPWGRAVPRTAPEDDL
jgi:hypothetical protein